MAEHSNSPNRALRLGVLAAMLVVSIGIVWAVGRNSGRPSATAQPPQSASPQAAPGASTAPVAGTSAPAPGNTGGSTGQPVAPTATGSTSVEQAASAAATPQPVPAVPAGGYRAAVFPGDPLATTLAAIGSLDSKISRGEMTFSTVGGGIHEYRLSSHFIDWTKTTHLTVQGERTVEHSRQPDGSVAPATLTPMAALGVYVNDSFVVLATSPGGPTWRQVAANRPGVLEAFVETAAGERVLRIERAYSITPGYDVRISQTVKNLSGAPVRVRWLQLGPVDLPLDPNGYGGDRRRAPRGYLLPSVQDPSRQVVLSKDYAGAMRDSILGGAPGVYPPELDVWPDQNAVEKQLELSWAGMTDRYFAAAAHPVFDPAAPNPNKLFSWVRQVKRVLVNTVGPDGGPADPVVAYRLDSGEFTIAAGGSLDLSMGAWMGPLSPPVIGDDPLAKSLGLDGMVLYNMGGPCALCTFDAITFILRNVMHFLHDSIFRDWSLAIIFLVVFVRTCLHPLTRWSQIRMQRFGKQMSLMQPKQKKIQERYKDDPKKVQAEMAALWREEGISPFGMLGCLPMLLVTPVWLSLYALLYYAVELRNAPAFYGVIQTLTGNGWGFLADLSQPDALITFGTALRIPLVGWPIASLNILPLLLGLVFYFHQKYLTPPSATPLTPEQEMQQKMVKIMSVLLFPIFMYNAPAGLALYFTTNSALAIVENAWIRKHMDKHGLLDEDKLKRKARDPNAKGFMQKLMEAADQKRKLAEAQARKDQVDRGRGRK